MTDMTNQKVSRKFGKTRRQDEKEKEEMSEDKAKKVLFAVAFASSSGRGLEK